MLGQVHDLDLQLLRLFVCVVECGGFSAAQGELGLSQSSISQQLAKLESRLGYRLCSRGKSGFSVTPKGEQLLSAIRELFQSIEAFRHQSNGVAGRLIGEVRLGFSEALDPSVLQKVAAAIRRFRQRDESVRIELISAMPGRWSVCCCNSGWTWRSAISHRCSVRLTTGSCSAKPNICIVRSGTHYSTMRRRTI